MIEHYGPPKSISSEEILCEVKDLEDLILTKAPHMKRKISHEKGEIIRTRKV